MRGGRWAGPTRPRPPAGTHVVPVYTLRSNPFKQIHTKYPPINSQFPTPPVYIFLENTNANKCTHYKDR